MPDPHPFNGRWTSYGLNSAGELFFDGTMDFEIEPNGNFVSGQHTPINDDGSPGTPVALAHVVVTRNSIHVREVGTPFCIYHGFLVQNPFVPNQKVTAGGYRIPTRSLPDRVKGSKGRLSDADRTQENGTWVATQP